MDANSSLSSCTFWSCGRGYKRTHWFEFQTSKCVIFRLRISLHFCSYKLTRTKLYQSSRISFESFPKGSDPCDPIIEYKIWASLLGKFSRQNEIIRLGGELLLFPLFFFCVVLIVIHLKYGSKRRYFYYENLKW